MENISRRYVLIRTSAAVVAVVKCTHIPGLANESDPTCESPQQVDHNLHG